MYVLIPLVGAGAAPRAATGANRCLTLRLVRSGRAKRRRTKKKDDDYEWGGDDVAEAPAGAADGNTEAADER